MNLWAKFNLRFKEDRKNAYEEQDIKWVKQYYEVDKELFDKEYANWKSNQVKLLREDNVPLKEANRRLARWEKRFNPKHDTAWLNPSNPFIFMVKSCCYTWIYIFITFSYTMYRVMHSFHHRSGFF